MPTGAVRSTQDVEDLVRGLTLMGTGGGGRPEVGRRLLTRHVEAGRAVGWRDIRELSRETLTASVFSMGSIAPTRVLSREERAKLGYGDPELDEPMVEAVRLLTRHTGRTPGALVAFELGAGNTAGPMSAAAVLGLDLLDADYAGRAIPELSQTLAGIRGVPFWPGAIVDSWGNRLVFESAPSLAVAERVGKMVSTVTRLPDPTLTCAHAGFLVPVRDLAGMVIPGSISRAFAVGRAIRRAVEAGQDPVRAAADALGGWVLFTGGVQAKPWESRDGYMFGETLLEGDRACRGRTLRIWYQNENHIAWRDGETIAMSPDLIMVLGQDGASYTNASLPEGARVGVVAAQAHAYCREPAALSVLEPRHYGFDIAYVPIEELMTGAGIGR